MNRKWLWINRQFLKLTVRFLKIVTSCNLLYFNYDTTAAKKSPVWRRRRRRRSCDAGLRCCGGRRGVLGRDYARCSVGRVCTERCRWCEGRRGRDEGQRSESDCRRSRDEVQQRRRSSPHASLRRHHATVHALRRYAAGHLPPSPDTYSLPDFIRDPTSSTDCFRRLLKTYLFARY